MNFDLEGVLESAKEKTVEAATEKFGSGATPVAEEVADKMEEVVFGKLCVPLQHGESETTWRERDDGQQRPNAATQIPS